MGDDSSNWDVLDKLIKMFRDANTEIRVGIFEDTPRFSGNAGDSGAVDQIGNASLGAVHEFGNASTPQRSFLRMPLETHLESFLSKAKINEDSLEAAIEDGDLSKIEEQVAEAALACVHAAFDTGGFGAWVPHSPNTRSSTGKLLEETEQLKRSIEAQIVKK